MNRKRFVHLGLAFFGFSFSLFYSCTEKAPLNIGFVAGLSGRNADLGVAGRNGAMLAVEQRNAAGGIDGRTINLIARDDNQENEIAKHVVSDLIEQKIEAIIGPMTSSIAMATIALVNDSLTVMVSPTATTTKLSNLDDHFLRVIGSTRSYARRQARFQIEKLGNQTAVAIYDKNNSAYTESWLRDFCNEYEAIGGTLLKATGYASKRQNSFFDMVQSLLQAQPDVLIVISNAFDAALICQQVRKINATLPIAMAEWAATERFIELAGRASENVFLAQFIDRNSKAQRYIQFHQAYVARFGKEPGFAGVAGYDAAHVVLESYAKMSKPGTLKETIISTHKFQGLQQTIEIDRFGDAERKTFLSVVRNGRYETVGQ